MDDSMRANNSSLRKLQFVHEGTQFTPHRIFNDARLANTRPGMLARLKDADIRGRGCVAPVGLKGMNIAALTCGCARLAGSLALSLEPLARKGEISRPSLGCAELDVPRGGIPKAFFRYRSGTRPGEREEIEKMFHFPSVKYTLKPSSRRKDSSASRFNSRLPCGCTS